MSLSLFWPAPCQSSLVISRAVAWGPFERFAALQEIVHGVTQKNVLLVKVAKVDGIFRLSGYSTAVVECTFKLLYPKT